MPKTFGKRGEETAVSYLLSLGYEVLATNYRRRFGEIDIIAKERDTYIFVEVKARRGIAYGSAVEAIGKRKRQRLIQAALSWLKEKDLNEVPLRFDVVFLEKGRDGRLEIGHIKDAFGEDIP